MVVKTFLKESPQINLGIARFTDTSFTFLVRDLVSTREISRFKVFNKLFYIINLLFYLL